MKCEIHGCGLKGYPGVKGGFYCPECYPDWYERFTGYNKRRRVVNALNKIAAEELGD
jgi:hypothetical protein